MAASKSKRSATSTQRQHCAFRKLVHFPHAKGKTIEDLEFSSTSDYHNISINFQDKTALNFSIETGFTVKPDYSDWKSGNQKVLRAWRPMPNKK